LKTRGEFNLKLSVYPYEFASLVYIKKILSLKKFEGISEKVGEYSHHGCKN